MTREDIKNFRWMITNKYVPFQKIPTGGGKTFEEIEKLGSLLFPHSEFSFELALSVYDWTTADFARIQFLNLFTYGSVLERGRHTFDINNIANAIWTSNWEPYIPSDKYYMNVFMMKPARSLTEVQSQLHRNLTTLDIMNESECSILYEALTLLPRLSCADIEKLYSGQVDINNLGTGKFATYFVELPANNDLQHPPLEMDLESTLNGFLRQGSIVTLKTFMSFADTYEVAKKYNNGIVLTVVPPRNANVWSNTAYVTPLSNESDKNEYLLIPGTQFRVNKITRNHDKLIDIEFEVMQ